LPVRPIHTPASTPWFRSVRHGQRVFRRTIAEAEGCCRISEDLADMLPTFRKCQFCTATDLKSALYWRVSSDRGDCPQELCQQHTNPFILRRPLQQILGRSGQVTVWSSRLLQNSSIAERRTSARSLRSGCTGRSSNQKRFYTLKRRPSLGRCQFAFVGASTCLGFLDGDG
jgi:hypothetical protein